MPRPKTVSDEAVLAAALDVLAQRGTGFTLSQLAERVGLSRATLIQRFGDRDAILLRMAQHEVELTRSWLDSLPVAVGRDAAWDFIVEIVTSMGAGDGFGVRVAMAALETEEAALRACASARYRLVEEAIAARLPAGAEREQIAVHLHTVIAGATMHWVASDQSVGLDTYVLTRCRWAFERLL